MHGEEVGWPSFGGSSINRDATVGPRFIGGTAGGSGRCGVLWYVHRISSSVLNLRIINDALLVPRLQCQGGHLPEQTHLVEGCLVTAEFSIDCRDGHSDAFSIRPGGVTVQRNILSSLEGRHASFIALAGLLQDIIEV